MIFTSDCRTGRHFRLTSSFASFIMALRAMKGISRQGLCFREEMAGVKFLQKSVEPALELPGENPAPASVIGEWSESAVAG